MSEWIKVKDNLPPIDKLVLCSGSKGGLFLGSTSQSCLYDNCNYIYVSVPNARSGRHCTHWMPLPEPPKE